MRTNYNGELRKENLNEQVRLDGWVNKNRKLGGLIFIDIRDITGICQVVVRPESEFFELAESITNESVIEVEGKVVLRESPNFKIPTGEVEVEASKITLLSKAEPLPIDKKSNDDIRLKYRYLDLRNPELQNIFKTKSKVLSIIRNYLNENRFTECETPILCKSTPEGARDYLVPSRIFKGEFYALPQSPQILKQLLMVAGMDRYYQIAKCFRDEDLRADRQPEFTQIDMETSFLNDTEIQTICEGMYKKIWKEIFGDKKTDLIIENKEFIRLLSKLGNKVLRDDLKPIEEAEDRYNDDIGLFIDIFPIDYLGNTTAEVIKLYNKW